MKTYPKPSRFDANLIVVGAGSAGLVSAYIAAAVQAKVILIEKHRMGGDCLNTGCVPSKALIRAARFVHQAGQSQALGIKSTQLEFEFAEIMQRVHEVIARIEPHDSVERYSRLGVEVIQGEARLTGPWSVEVGDRTLRARNIIIAAGAEPFIPPIKGIEKIKPLTSDTLWDLKELPRRLLVLGGGPIGCELAQSFQRLGSDVTQVELLPRLMAREDEDVSEYIQHRFEAEGVKVLCNHRAVEFLNRDGETRLLCENELGTVELPFDEVLIAVGRAARLEGFGLKELEVPISSQRTIEVNEYLQAAYPSIYACGDIAGPYQFTHTASHQAWYATINALFGRFKKFKVDYRVIPWATFTDPEVARVGLNRMEADAKGIAYELSRYPLDDLDRAIAEGEDHGWIEVLTPPGKDKILGATIVGAHAGDLIAEFVLAMRHGLGLNKILSTIHIYPTRMEAVKFTAGNWKKAQVKPWQRRWLQRFHRWQRG